MFIYADNAATTAVSRASLSAMLPYFTEQYGNPSSLYAFGQSAREALDRARETMARGLGAEPDEIYFTSGGSEADNQAILSAAEYGEKHEKKHIITTKFEHHAVLHTLKKLEKRGFEVTYLDVHKSGVISAGQVAEAIRPDTVLVTVMFANNEVGTVQPIAEIGAVCREKGVWLHTDAVQAAGHLEIDVKRMQIDLLSLSAHKFHGPKGAGVLFARRGIPLVNVIEGGAQERGKRAGTENTAAIVGMAAAFDEAVKNLKANAAYVSALRDRLIAGLEVIPHSVLNGDRERRLPGNMNMCFEGVEGEALLLYLDEKGIAASSGSACTSGSLEPSHVLLALGLPHEVAHGSLRLTLCENNTMEEVEYIIKAVPEVIERLRAMSPVWDELEKGEIEHVI